MIGAFHKQNVVAGKKRITKKNRRITGKHCFGENESLHFRQHIVLCVCDIRFFVMFFFSATQMFL